MTDLLVSPDVAPHPDTGPALRLADGVELVGEYHGSGYREPKFLVNRPDGQVIQLPRLLYRLAAALDGHRDAAAVAALLRAELSQDIGAAQVRHLVETKLAPAGIAAGGLGTAARIASPRPDPLLMLRFRLPVVSQAAVWRIAGVVAPIFHPVPVVVALAAFAAVDVAIVLGGGFGAVAAATVGLVQAPASALLVILVLLGAGMLHECGHVGACRYGGARPGPMGVGIYLVWPAYYSTVTDSYRLSRAGRLRTDLGGVYVNAIVMAAGGAGWLATGEPWLLVTVLILHAETARQFLPSIRLDGYYILSDLIGLPDLFMFLRPVLSGLLPGREPHPRVAELKPRVRRIIVAWVLLVVPFLLSFLVLFVVLAPQVLPVVWQGVLDQLATIGAAVRTGDGPLGTLGVLRLLLSLLPVLGTTLLVGLLVRRVAGWLQETPRPRAARARPEPLLSLLLVGVPVALLGLLTVAGADQRAAAPGEADLVAAAATAGGPALPGTAAGRAAAHQIAAVDALLGDLLGSGLLTAARSVLVGAGVLTALLLWPVARRLRLPGPAAALVVALAAIPALAAPLHGTVDAGGIAALWLAVAVALAGRGRGAHAAALLAAMVGVLTAPVAAVGLLTFAAHAVLVRRIAKGLRRGASWAVAAGLGVGAVAAAGLTVSVGAGGMPFSVIGPVLAVGIVVVPLAVHRLGPLRPVASAAAALLCVAAVPGPHSGGAVLIVVPVLAVLAGVYVYARSDPDRPRQVRAALGTALAAAVLGVGPAVVAAAAPDPDPHRPAAWVTAELGPGTVLGGDPLTLAQLAADGVPRDRLVAMEDPAATVLAGTADAVAADGPELLTLPAGPAGLPFVVRAGSALPAGPELGPDLAGNPALDLAPDAASTLRAGRVDPRITLTLAGLAGVHDIAVAAFPAVPGEPATAARRTAVVTEVDGVPVTDPAAAAVLVRWLEGQQPPFRPDTITPTAGGSAVHYPIETSRRNP